MDKHKKQEKIYAYVVAILLLIYALGHGFFFGPVMLERLRGGINAVNFDAAIELCECILAVTIALCAIRKGRIIIKLFPYILWGMLELANIFDILWKFDYLEMVYIPSTLSLLLMSFYVLKRKPIVAHITAVVAFTALAPDCSMYIVSGGIIGDSSMAMKLINIVVYEVGQNIVTGGFGFPVAIILLAEHDTIMNKIASMTVAQGKAQNQNNGEENEMKYCAHCGKEILTKAVICPHCGCQVETAVSVVENSPSRALNIISFLLPVVGLILYLVYFDKAPVRAAAIGKWALYGVGLCVICYVLLTACGASMLYSLY